MILKAPFPRHFTKSLLGRVWKRMCREGVSIEALRDDLNLRYLNSDDAISTSAAYKWFCGERDHGMNSESYAALQRWLLKK